jgi:DNA-directed RNA polymerase subunit RPC12/RpoP
MRKLKIEQAEARHPDLIKGQRWGGARAKYSYRCAIHGIYEQRFSSHNNGQRCRECGARRISKAQSLTIKQAEARHPDLVKGQKWCRAGAKYKYRCAVHGIYKQQFHHHDRGSSCRKCGIERRIKKQGLSSVRAAERRFPEMIKGQPWRGGRNAKYDYHCQRHGIYKQSFEAHAKGQRCPKCAWARIATARSLTVKQAEKKYSDFAKGQKWRGSSGKYQFNCPHHGVYKQQFCSHYRSGCRKCGYERHGKSMSLTITQAERKCPDMVKGQVWRGTAAKYDFRCPVHGIYRQAFNQHQSGKGCNECAESKGERRITRFLKDSNLSFERQRRFGSCRNFFPLPFDFHLVESCVLIEFHGKQHYKPVEWFGGRKTLREIQHRDTIKRRWARRNGYKLIVVPFTVKNIEEYLTKRLGLQATLAKAA